MNYSIKVINKNNQESVTEINGSGKIAVLAADKIQILSNDSGVLSFFGIRKLYVNNFGLFM